MLSFQSYLILGSPQKRRESTQNLFTKSKVDLGKVSADISIISPIKTKVTIDQIRDLKSRIFQKPVSLPHKIVIIEEAEKLTTEAQNALLKILEEPPASAIIILEAKDKTRILPTILSRVVMITSQEKREEETASILASGKDTLDLLEEISTIENPSAWLDGQMLTLYNSLQKAAKSSHRHSRPDRESDPRIPARNATHSVAGGREDDKTKSIAKIQSALEQCARAREMIEANVNPRHVLANLILNLK